MLKEEHGVWPALPTRTLCVSRLCRMKHHGHQLSLSNLSGLFVALLGFLLLEACDSTERDAPVWGHDRHTAVRKGFLLDTRSLL